MSKRTRNGIILTGRAERLVMDDLLWDTIVDGTSGTTAVQDEPGYVYLEWVGQPSPFDDLTIRYLMQRGLLPIKVRDMLRTIARRRNVRMDGRSQRVMLAGNGSRDIKGLSHDITFGPKVKAKPGTPHSYIQRVSNHDADAIMSSASGHEFRIIGLASHELDPVRVAVNTVKQGREIITGPERRFKKSNDFHKAMGRQ